MHALTQNPCMSGQTRKCAARPLSGGLRYHSILDIFSCDMAGLDMGCHYSLCGKIATRITVCFFKIRLFAIIKQFVFGCDCCLEFLSYAFWGRESSTYPVGIAMLRHSLRLQFRHCISSGKGQVPLGRISCAMPHRIIVIYYSVYRGTGLYRHVQSSGSL